MHHRKDFTFDPYNFPQTRVQSLAKMLHQNHQQMVMIVDPAIAAQPGYEAYDSGVKGNVFVKDNRGADFIGSVWPGRSVYPDFFNPATQQYWSRLVRQFWTGTDIDGIWLDMNEAANFCNGSCEGTANENRFNFPQYQIDNKRCRAHLFMNTLPMDAVYYSGFLEYNVHNLYGLTETRATYSAVLELQEKKRPFLISRSTFSGSGRFTGHWTGDNFSTWDQMYLSISQNLNFQLFGIPMVGADICGFVGDTSEELCARWMALGSFYPLSRNHNSKDQAHQEPYLWPKVAEVSRKYLNLRYSLISYWYTLFYKAHKLGEPVLNALSFLYPQDEQTYSLDRQFFVGEALLISPNLNEGANEVSAYFPAGSWYDLVSQDAMWFSHGKWVTLSAPIDVLPVHIAGGSIITQQEPRLTVKETVETSYTLIIALDGSKKAKGDLFFDDGNSPPTLERHSFIHFAADFGFGTSKIISHGTFGFPIPTAITKIKVFGWEVVPTRIFINEKSEDAFESSAFPMDSRKKVGIELCNLEISLSTEFMITFNFD